MISKKSIWRGIQLYFANSIIYYLGLFFCQHFPYYQKALNFQTQQILIFLFFGYIIFTPLFYVFLTKEYSTNKSYLILKTLVRNIIVLFKRIAALKKNEKNKFSLEPEEKTAFLFLGVKFFFLPTMLNFLINNFSSLSAQIIQEGLQPHWFSLLLNFLFTFDTLIFAFGYTFESRTLHNLVKSVEPTFFGWFVTLICYPPFNSIIGNYIPWGANDYVLFWNPLLTIIFRIIIILLLIIFVLASFSLGLKASNLTNRGIVTKFPYSLVRHPAYTSKCLLWWLTLLPVINLPLALGMLFWTIIYYFRAMTEERHLRQDNDYLQYCEKVKWKFIPTVI